MNGFKNILLSDFSTIITIFFVLPVSKVMKIYEVPPQYHYPKKVQDIQQKETFYFTCRQVVGFILTNTPFLSMINFRLPILNSLI